MKVLCVAEKPSIAKSIAGILAGDGRSSNRPGKDKYCRNYDLTYNLAPHGWVNMTITSVLGHLTSTDFPEQYRAWHSCDPVAVFDAPVETCVPDNMQNVAKNLRQEARGARILMIWTDCDREGEHIGSEIITECRKVNARIEVQRARFSAIIANQIHNACQNAGQLDWQAAQAVQARQELDLKVGAAMTRLQTLNLQVRISQLNNKVISYGPCQFPTLGFVVDRYDRIQNFVAEDFWSIHVVEERRDAPSLPLQKVDFKWKRNHLFDESVVRMLHQSCKDRPTATVSAVISKPTKKFKPYPLTTVELQKSGSRLLRMAPKKILDLAEALYQKGYLSYPRTETDQYDAQFDFHSLIRKQTSDADWGAYAQGLEDGAYERPRNGKKNDKAHPPIHPTAHANNLTAEERKVYEYVTRRFLASCSKDALGTQSTVEIDIAAEQFSANGLIVQERNYLDVFVYDKWGGSVLPRFQRGETFQPKSCTVKKGSTTPPNLLTEADLVSLMDKNGIGTDATIAEHIAKIIQREYVTTQVSGKVTYLSPSPLGRGLVEGYNEIDFEKSLSKPILRRETEFRMNLICQGQRTKDETVEESLAEYKAMFLRARAQFAELARCVGNRLNVRVDEARAAAAAIPDVRPPQRPPRGPGPGRGAGNPPPRNDDDDDEGDSDDHGDGPAMGGVGIPGPGPRSTAAASRRANNTSNAQAPAAWNNRDDLQDPSPSCGCGVPAVKRTVSKEGANKGRKFWTCSKAQNDDSRCGFFDWASDNRGGDLPSSSGSAPTMVTAPRRTEAAARSPRRGVRKMHTAVARPWQDAGDDDEFKDVYEVVDDSFDLDGVGEVSDGEVVFVESKSIVIGAGSRPIATRVLSPTRQASRALIDEVLNQSGDEAADHSPTQDRRVGRIDEYRAWFASLGEGDEPASSGSGGRISDNGTRRCDCGLESSMREVFKDGPNKGRKFYSCPKENAGVRCRMFEWADEASEGNSENLAPWERPALTRPAQAQRGGGRGATNPSRNSSDVCFKCGEGGHWASDCPNDGPMMTSSNAYTNGPRASAPGGRGRGRGRGGRGGGLKRGSNSGSSAGSARKRAKR